MTRIVQKAIRSDWGRISLAVLLISGLVIGTMFALVSMFDFDVQEGAPHVTVAPDADAPVAEAASGDVIILWDGAIIPSGWTCISCNPGDAFYQIFPRASSSYSNATAGGPELVTHTATFSTTSGVGAFVGQNSATAGTAAPDYRHTHTWGNPTLTSVDIKPSYQSLKMISANNPSQLPNGAIGMFKLDAVRLLPQNWDYYSALDGKYLRGDGNTSTGGASTHVHTSTVAVTSGNSAGALVDAGAALTTASGVHNHTLPAGSATFSEDNEPPYFLVQFAKLNTTSSIPAGLLAFFNATPTGNWVTYSTSTSGAGMAGDLLKGARYTYNFGLGTSTHTHSAAPVSGGPSATFANKAGSAADTNTDTHTHTLIYNLSYSNAMPIYRDVIVAQYQPSSTMKQAHYRWRNDDGAEGPWEISNVNASNYAEDPSPITMVDANTTYIGFNDVGAYKLAKTFDGGDTWATVDISGNPKKISAISSSTIYSAYIGWESPYYTTSLAKSINGGTTWTTSTIQKVSPYQGNISALHAITNSSTLYIIYQAYDGNNHWLIFGKSINSGTSWTTSTLASVSGSFFSAGLGVTPEDPNIIYASYHQGSSYDLQIRKSTDGGASWATAVTIDPNVIENQGQGGGDAIGVANSSTLYIVYMPSDNVVFLEGAVTAILAKSVNGGTSWTTSTLDIAPEIDWYAEWDYPAISVFGNTVIIAADTDRNNMIVMQSVDGGVSWASTTVDSIDAKPAIDMFDASTTFMSFNYQSSSDSDLRFAKSVSEATAAGSQDTSVSVNKYSTARLRFSIDNDGWNTTSTRQFRLEYATATSNAWTQVGNPSSTSAHWVMKNSTYLNNGSSTLNSPLLADPPGTFVAGQARDTINQTAGIGLLWTEFTELEYSIAATSTAIDGTTYYFRLTNAGNAAGFNYSIYASATVAAAVGSSNLTQIHYRWRNDDGSEATATWAAATDTPISSVTKQTVQRLRFEVSNEGTATSSPTPYRLEYATSTGAATWTRVGTSSASTAHWVTILSSLTNASNTSNVSNGLPDENTTFVAGRQHETSSESAAITLGTTQFTELEYAITATTTALDSTTYYFRLTASGTALTTYTRYASATVAAAAGPPNLTQIHYRWRNDNGDGGDSGSSSSVASTTAFTASDDGFAWTQTSCTGGTCATTYDGADGNPGGTIGVDMFGRNQTHDGYFSKVVTWEQLGVPAGAVVDSVDASIDYKLYLETHAATQALSLAIFDSGNSASILAEAKLEPSFDPTSATWATRNATGSVPVLAGSQSSSASVSLRIEETIVSGNNVSAESQVRIDNLVLTISYTIPGTGATWAANLDTPTSSVAKQTLIRLRLEVSNEGGDATSTAQFRLEYATSTGASTWIQVGTTSASTAHWVMAPSANFTDGASTTDVTNGLTNENDTFDAGQIKDTSNQTAGILLASTEFTELEYSIAATSTAINEQTYYFRLTNAGTALNAYTAYASATIAAGVVAPSNVRQVHWRWRINNGGL